MPNTIRLHRVLRAPAERVYRAFTSPEALVKWLPPNGFTGIMHQFDARVGGTYRMSFRNMASGESHSFSATYLELVPHQRIVHTDRFDDPNLPGDMMVEVTLDQVPSGTELSVVQHNIPDPIPPDACLIGWHQSLILLALLVETEPGG